MIIFTRREEVSGDLFILDDVSPLGINLSKAFFDSFCKAGKVTVFNAEELASELVNITASDNPLLVGSGAVLAYTLMSRYGFRRDLAIVSVKRTYETVEGDKRPRIKFEISGDLQGRTECLDDIIASGATINQIGNNLTLSTLLTSNQTRGEYRTKQGSTIKNVSKLFTAQRVNSPRGFPAIFSTRFLVGQVPTNIAYQNYVSKYADITLLLAAISQTDIAPLKELYTNPREFIRRYGG